jgi:choline dehydrogenase-like flavoprotein
VETEVCIIGAGAAGGIIAAELGRRGVNVVVLEAGPRHRFERRADYARAILKGDEPWRTPLAALDRYTTAGSVPYYLNPKRARGVGGSTLYWEGYAFRFHPDDFKLRTRHGIADDWPLSYDDLEPYYAKAEAAFGVAGAADDPWGPPRRSDFPLPPFPFSYADGFYRRACASLGVAFAHMPQARNSKEYGGRPACSACAVCHACPTGARASADLTHIAQAEATGRVTVLGDVSALRLEVDATDRLTGVVFAGHDRQRDRVTPRICVVAGGGVETPRLLLLSATSRFPQGLANRSGLVGKRFMTHPSTDVMGRVAQPVYPHRIGFATAMSRQFAVTGPRRERAAFFLEFRNAAELGLGYEASATQRWGAELRATLKADFGRALGIRPYCEQLPDDRNTVTLDPEVRDHHGDPGPRLTYDVGDYERRALREANAIASKILTQAGASDIETSRLHYAAHQIGTHRMGNDPRTSVVNRDLRTHDVQNLYLVGAGAFVTSTPSPPTLTIAALAIRAADHIARELGR